MEVNAVNHVDVTKNLTLTLQGYDSLNNPVGINSPLPITFTVNGASSSPKGTRRELAAYGLLHFR